MDEIKEEVDRERIRMTVVRKECDNQDPHLTHCWRENSKYSPLFLCFGTKNKVAHG